MIVYREKHLPNRRGMMAVEHVMATAVFFVAAYIVMSAGFTILRLIHHAIATLAGWPSL